MPQCPNGHSSVGRSRFCSICGEELRPEPLAGDSVNIRSPKSDSDANAQATQTVIVNQPTSPSQPTSQQEAHGNRNVQQVSHGNSIFVSGAAIVAVLAVIGVVIVAVIAILLLRQSESVSSRRPTVVVDVAEQSAPVVTTVAQMSAAIPDTTRTQVTTNATRTTDAVNVPSVTPAPTETPTTLPTETPTVTPTETPRPTATLAPTPTTTQRPTPDATATTMVEATQTQQARAATGTVAAQASATRIAQTISVMKTTSARVAAEEKTQAVSETQTAVAQTAAAKAAQAVSAAQTAEAKAAAAARSSETGRLIFSPVEKISPVESSHSYENNLDKSWYISNDSGLNAMQIYFSRIEIDDGVDLIHITDPDGGLLQEITTSHPDGLWSEMLPGPGAYVVLKTDSADVRWGFKVDAMAAGNYTTLARSPHPYPNNYDGFVVLYNNEANPAGTRVVFDRIELEEGVDYIVISDVDGNPYQWITGSHPDGLTSKAMPGPAIQVKLISDGSVRAWGYNIVDVQTARPDKAEALPIESGILAETNHPYCDRCEKTWTITNSDVSAKSSKVHFTKIDFTKDTRLQILDANDTVIQTFGGSTNLENVWSDYVPGRVVKLKLINTYDFSRWGFRADAIASSVPNPGLAQTDHPYCDRCEKTWTITNSDVSAKSSKVHFTKIDFTSNTRLQILDANDTVIQTFGGSTNLENVWSDYIPGRVVRLKLINTYDFSRWGFRVDLIASK